MKSTTQLSKQKLSVKTCKMTAAPATPCRPPPGFTALAVATPAMVIPRMTRRRPPAIAAPEAASTAGPGMDDTFVMILYNMYLRICAQEKENAELKIKCYQLHTEVLREERAVQRAEEWVRENQDSLPKLENILLAKEERLNQCTGSLTKIIDKTEELRPKGDEVFDQAQRLQATLESLRWKVEEEEAQWLIQGYQEHYASLEHEKVQVVLEEKTKEEKEVILEEETKEEKEVILEEETKEEVQVVLKGDTKKEKEVVLEEVTKEKKTEKKSSCFR
ncbi:trichohyalin-like [Coregonus clupeaformis]|uniref:trichohyalin-like n=1 Tax=Coregonus clupeaformis TaxID=59861 RepID=UPI001BE051EF|nr:trichohyalin-like [Coregonus clupeaformis]